MTALAHFEQARRRLLLMAAAMAASLTVAVAPPQSRAAGPDPQAVVNFVATQGMATLGAGVSPAQRTARLSQLFGTYFDAGHLAAFALGRYRAIATAQQQQEYYRLYEEYTAASYGSQLAQVGVAPFRVIGSRILGGQIVVASEIVPSSGNAVQIDWYLVNRHGKYKISDVIIAGNSMRLTQRNEFAGWVGRNGGRFDALLAVLRQEIAQMR